MTTPRARWTRDEHGIPQITAEDIDGLYWGMGYCHAMDRGLQMLIMRILGQGRAVAAQVAAAAVRPAADPQVVARIVAFVLVGTTATGAVPYDRFDWTRPIAVALGSEGGGLPDEVVARLDATVAIPMARGIESLSVGAAAAVVLFEAARRRGTAAAD